VAESQTPLQNRKPKIEQLESQRLNKENPKPRIAWTKEMVESKNRQIEEDGDELEQEEDEFLLYFFFLFYSKWKIFCFIKKRIVLF
jgi:hypothetical protein